MPKANPNRHAIVVEDDPFFAEVIASALPAEGGQWRVHAFSTVQATLEALSHDLAGLQLAVVDLGLPDGDGLDVIRALHRAAPATPVLVVSANTDEHRVLDAVRCGASGYIVKGDSHISITEAITHILSGVNPISPQLARLFLNLAREASPPAATDDNPSNLTPRELELLRHFATGASYANAAQLMGISLLTVQTHARNLYRKLGARSNLEALAKAQRQGLL